MQLTLCQSLHAKALQAIVSEGLAHGPFMTAGVGFEPATSGQKASTLPMRHHAHEVYSLKYIWKLIGCLLLRTLFHRNCLPPFLRLDWHSWAYLGEYIGSKSNMHVLLL